MQLVTFSAAGEERLGALLNDQVVDVARLAERSGRGTLPSTLLGLIDAGPAAWASKQPTSP